MVMQASRLLEGAVVLIWHGVWTLTDIITTGMVELLIIIKILYGFFLQN